MKRLALVVLLAGCAERPKGEADKSSDYRACIGNRQYMIVSSREWPYTNMAIPLYDDSDKLLRCKGLANKQQEKE